MQERNKANIESFFFKLQFQYHINLLNIMLNIMYNNAAEEYLWVLIMPKILCYQLKVTYIMLNISSQ